MKKKRVYLDYAATTPLDPLVQKAMEPYFSRYFGNAGSLHSFGQEAIKAVDQSRESIARQIGAGFREIIFTGSATEANNLALRGVIKAVRMTSCGTDRPLAPAASGGLHSRQSDSAFGGDRAPTACESCRTKTSERLKIITSAIEHESVLETCRDLEREGAEVVYLPVDKAGAVDLEKLKQALDERTVLVSVMYANNEIGAIQPISKISKIIRDFREQSQFLNYESRIMNHGKKDSIIHNSRFTLPLFHTDAAQAFQYLDCCVGRLGVDLMTISAHKIYGPKGIGVLYVRENYELRIMNHGKKDSIIHNSRFMLPIVTGGGQEFGLRSGTENVPSIVGFAKAGEIAVSKREREKERVAGLRDYLWGGIKAVYPRAEMNGDGFYRTDRTDKSYKTNRTNRTDRVDMKNLSNILNIYFSGFRADELLIRLDRAGIAASAGSACSSRSNVPSYVLKALGYGVERRSGSIRFSLGRMTVKSELDLAVRAIGDIING